MSDKYKTTSTSSVTATVEDRIISETTSTRKVLKAEIIENHKNPSAGLSMSIVHQRKSANTQWEDIEGKPLSKIKAGEAMKLSFDTSETKALFDELSKLYALQLSQGVVRGSNEFVVAKEHEVIFTDNERSGYIRELLRRGYSTEVWRELTTHEPQLADALAQSRLHAKRQNALSEFETNISSDKNENYWQEFFEKNEWIFGYGLDYRFLQKIQSQPNYGGGVVAGRGSQRGDFLAATTGEERFTVLVEIKTPKTQLVTKQYRNGAWLMGEDVTGGVSQIQINCRQWERQGSMTEENLELIQNVSTIQPKGILIVGNLTSLNSIAKKNSFELFRRSVSNPVIMTFDELLEKARFIVNHTMPVVGQSE